MYKGILNKECRAAINQTNLKIIEYRKRKKQKSTRERNFGIKREKHIEKVQKQLKRDKSKFRLKTIEIICNNKGILGMSNNVFVNTM